MKKRQRSPIKKFLGLFFIFCVLALFQAFFQKQESLPLKKGEIPFVGSVGNLKPLVDDELKRYHLENYSSVLLALIEQESHGKGGDPMQASESAGLPRNKIKDPRQSIQAGVKHFAGMLTYGEKKKVDFPTVIQAYNMGPGYIDFVAEHGGKHSEELAKQFSLLRVKEQPDIYTCGGDKKNFRYPYCYGDFTYSTKVMKWLDGAVPVMTAEKKPTDIPN